MNQEFIAQCINTAHAANARHEFATAIWWSRKAIELVPQLPEAWFNLGVALGGEGKRAEAIRALEEASACAQDDANAQNSIGLRFIELLADEQAEQCLRRAMTLVPAFVFPYVNLAKLRAHQKRFDEEELAARKAVALDPRSSKAWSSLAKTLFALKRYQAAADGFSQSLELDPEEKYLEGSLIHARALVCHWETLAADLPRLLEHLEQGKVVCMPFPLLALTESLSLQRKAAEIYAADQFASSTISGGIQRLPRTSKKIRIGYFSADFRDHPVSHLLVETLELHDRAHFEVIGFAFSPDTQDKVRQRVVTAFDRFIDCHAKTDAEVVALSRDLRIDIAVDLGGYTEDARTRVFALRAAPVQVSYLGYLGTMGVPFIDYLMADKTIIPDEYRSGYAEKIVYLPSYQANDSKRQISDKIYTRDELGLPPTGFVFCCFNHNYKITPEAFDAWMRILSRVDESVLLLYADNDQVAENLRQEARKSGVAPDRLVFAGRVERSLYLARYRVADLFLDTFPYNAGTTASDALWAGLPVLTRMGESFASRVAASVLTALDLPELITSSQKEYEDLAIELATKPQLLQQIKHKLSQQRLTQPLFDSRSFTRNLEQAYRQMHERSLDGLPPDHIQLAN